MNPNNGLLRQICRVNWETVQLILFGWASPSVIVKIFHEGKTKFPSSIFYKKKNVANIYLVPLPLYCVTS